MWKASAHKSAEAALDIYTERDDVERELALHLSRALRYLDRYDMAMALFDHQQVTP